MIRCPECGYRICDAERLGFGKGGGFCPDCGIELDDHEEFVIRDNPWQASCERSYPVGHHMTAAEERVLPDEAFGLIRWAPAQRGGVRRRGRPGRWHKRRKYQMPDVVHARNAKARASAAFRQGHLSHREYMLIVNKANKIIRRCREELVPARPRRAANPYYNPESYPAYRGDPTFKGHDCPVCWTPQCQCGPGYLCDACAEQDEQGRRGSMASPRRLPPSYTNPFHMPPGYGYGYRGMTEEEIEEERERREAMEETMVGLRGYELNPKLDPLVRQALQRIAYISGHEADHGYPIDRNVLFEIKELAEGAMGRQFSMGASGRREGGF
jgi:hypothetical protein